jgi:hypothetical protein
VTQRLEDADRAKLGGAEGPAMKLAMQLVVKAAEILGAEALVPISFAHLDSCFYTGQAHVDFARFLKANKARFAVPTWSNNGVVSLEQPDLKPESEDGETVRGARELMTLYAELGAVPTWTCAPYQLPGGPGFGDHVAVGESNAVAYYNSVVGARTNKYGGYLDVACAIAGKAPHAGLHLDRGREAELHIAVRDLPGRLRQSSLFPHLLGYLAGRICGRHRPVISGIPRSLKPDDLKAISAAAAASGGVEMWHGVDVTPEAPSLPEAQVLARQCALELADFRRAQKELTSAADGPLDCVALGTPHFSQAEFEALALCLDNRSCKTRLVVSTSRAVREAIAARGLLSALRARGVEIVADICTYYSPRLRGLKGRVMTNAAKWAWYAPGMIGVEVCFGSLEECVESAVRGEVWRDRTLWSAD